MDWPQEFKINRIKVTQTNPFGGGGKSRITVKLDGRVIAVEYVAKRSPFTYLKTLTRSKHFKSLKSQLKPWGVSLSDIGLKVKTNGS